MKLFNNQAILYISLTDQLEANVTLHSALDDFVACMDYKCSEEIPRSIVELSSYLFEMRLSLYHHFKEIIQKELEEKHTEEEYGDLHHLLNKLDEILKEIADR